MLGLGVADSQHLGESFLQMDSRGGQPTGAANKASNDDKRERCSGVGAKPRCEKLLDQLSQMKGAMIDAVDLATKTLNEHDEWCEAEISDINMEITNAKDIITARDEQFAKANAFKQ